MFVVCFVHHEVLCTIYVPSSPLYSMPITFTLLLSARCSYREKILYNRNHTLYIYTFAYRYIHSAYDVPVLLLLNDLPAFFHFNRYFQDFPEVRHYSVSLHLRFRSGILCTSYEPGMHDFGRCHQGRSYRSLCMLGTSCPLANSKSPQMPPQQIQKRNGQRRTCVHYQKASPPPPPPFPSPW